MSFPEFNQYDITLSGMSCVGCNTESQAVGKFLNCISHFNLGSVD